MEHHLVQLDRDHPGFRDLQYRKRRDAIAQFANRHRDGDPAPRVDYTADEHQVWQTARHALVPLHAKYASKSYLRGLAELQLPNDQVPQLIEVSTRLRAMTGFIYQPVAGLVTPREFLEGLSQRWFLATQYMRHHSMPLYTPEPDVIHEVLGHGPMLAVSHHAQLNVLFGEATKRTSDDRIDDLIRLYWYTLEFGLIREDGDLKAVGAGLLSSFGELGSFEGRAELKPFDIEVITQTPFDPTAYQATLFVAPSEQALFDELRARLES